MSEPLDNKRLERALDIFDRAANLPPDQIPAFLDHECGKDSGIRSKVEKYLENHGSPGLPDTATAPAAQDANRVPDRIGEFLIQRRISSGGMGEVFEAKDEGTGRTVALKRLLPKYSTDLAMLKREGEAAVALKHSAIVTLYTSREIDGRWVIAYEFISGGDLRRFSMRDARLPWEKVVRLVAQVADGLEDAHRRGLVHRDIKPANILLDETGNPKITDFGIAAKDHAIVTGQAGNPHTGDYAAPEQLDRKLNRIGRWSDIFSLGLVLYELLAGKRPPSVEERRGTIKSRGPDAQWAFLDGLDPNIPEAVRLACKRAIDLEIENRYGWASEMRDELSTALEDAERLPASSPCNIPPANPFFLDVGYIDKIHDLLVKGRPVALVGMPGVGKTQLATHYAHAHRDEYRFVFWVNASREALRSEFATIAQTIRHRLANASDRGRVIAAVKHWLATNTGWLLILDNADDLSLVGDFLPSPMRGHLILSTSDPSVRRLAEPIQVDILSENEGAELLLHRAGMLRHDQSLADVPSDVRDPAKALAREVGGLPLALDQAGAFIEEMQCSVGEYLELYHARGAELRSRRGNLGGSDHPSVAVTFSLAFERIQHRNPASAELLTACAFLSPMIPEEVFTHGTDELGDVLGPAMHDACLRLEVVRELQRFSLVSRNPSSRMLTIHRLTQDAVRDLTNEPAEWIARLERTIFRPCGYPDTHDPVFSKLFPCILVLLQWAEKLHALSADHSNLVGWVGLYLFHKQAYTQAATYYKLALDRWEHNRNERSGSLEGGVWFSRPDVLLGCGRTSEAAACAKSLLDDCRDSGVPDHWIVRAQLAQIKITYARILIQGGKGGHAKRLLWEASQAYETDSRLLGLRVPLTEALIRLACYERDYDRALALAVDALDECRANVDEFFENSADLAERLATVAAVHLERKEWKLAEQHYRDAVQEYRALYGTSDPRVAGWLAGLHRAVSAQGRAAEAAEFRRESEEIFASHGEQPQQAVVDWPRMPDAVETLSEGDSDVSIVGTMPMESVWPLLDWSSPDIIVGKDQLYVPLRVRRNDPCPCGSGKKYKRCCFRKIGRG